MKYMGSKARHAKEILPIILRGREENQWYVEPFVGGANTIDKVTGNRLASDINSYLIGMWNSVSNGWLPPQEFTESQYKDVKNNKDKYSQDIVGYAGFALSYGGKWFGGWCRDGQGARDYVAEAYRNATKQFSLLRGVEFTCSSYQDLEIPPKSLIYCDPPYKGTTKYKDNFDHESFYNWCRQKQKEGHSVYVSEYDMTEDFKCVWSKIVNSSLTADTGGKKNTEKLFMLEAING